MSVLCPGPVFWGAVPLLACAPLAGARTLAVRHAPAKGAQAGHLCARSVTRRSPVAPGRQRGFTLLEAIVALAVLAMAAMALYGWLNSSLVLLKRVDDVYQGIEAVESSLEWLQVIDPHQQPQGQQPIADAVAHWSCTARGNALPANDMHGNLSVNDAQLFDCQVVVVRGQEQLASFTLVKLGLQAKRSAEELLF